MYKLSELSYQHVTEICTKVVNKNVSQVFKMLTIFVRCEELHKKTIKLYFF